jgi:hypothetical protein
MVEIDDTEKAVIVCFLAALGAELISSFWLLKSIPTDTILVYYPTRWSYVGEHFLAWAAALSSLVVSLISVTATLKRPRLSHRVIPPAIGAISLVAELLSSWYLWFVATPEGVEPKLWYTGGFWTYVEARFLPWLMSFSLLAVVGMLWARKWNRSGVHSPRSNEPQVPDGSADRPHL